jgi:hypothetical protein
MTASIAPSTNNIVDPTLELEAEQGERHARLPRQDRRTAAKNPARPRILRGQPWSRQTSRLHDLARVLHATIGREPTAAEQARRRWEAGERRRNACDYASGVCATHGGPTTDKPLVLSVPKRQES